MTSGMHGSFRNMDRSPVAADRIEAEVVKLGRGWDIISLRVVMEALHRHRRFGHQHRMHIDLRAPGREFSVSYEPDLHPTLVGAGGKAPAKRTEVATVGKKDPCVVIRHAFDVARRRLEDGLRPNRGRRMA